MIFTFSQSYYISQLLTTDHDCPVPVDKHGSVKNFPQPLRAYRWSQRSNIKFSLNIFIEILHAGREAIDMKHIKQDYSLKPWVQSPGVDLGGGAEVIIKFFRNMVMLHIKLKLLTHAAT